MYIRYIDFINNFIIVVRVIIDKLLMLCRLMACLTLLIEVNHVGKLFILETYVPNRCDIIN